MSAPATDSIGVTHDRTARPPAITVQAPHCPRPQPNLGPRSAKSSLSTYKRGVAGSTSTVWERPLTVRAMLLMASLQPSSFRPDFTLLRRLGLILDHRIWSINYFCV